jgi:hypothetical protein
MLNVVGVISLTNDILYFDSDYAHTANTLRSKGYVVSTFIYLAPPARFRYRPLRTSHPIHPPAHTSGPLKIRHCLWFIRQVLGELLNSVVGYDIVIVGAFRDTTCRQLGGWLYCTAIATTVLCIP